MANGKQQKAPFRYSTRQRTQQIANTTANFGDRVTIEIPRVGFLAGLLVQVVGSLTRAGGDTGTFSERLFNLIQRIGVNLNLGAASIVDISGFGLYSLNHTVKYAYGPSMGGSIPAANDGNFNDDLNMEAHVYRATDTVPEVNSPFQLTYWIPVACNDGKNFNMGLINLQAPEVRATLDLQFSPNAVGLFTPGAVLAGTVFNGGQGFGVIVHYLYYEVPNPAKVLYPPLVVHRLLEERQAFNNTGDVLYTVPRQGTLMKLYHTLIINGRNDGYPGSQGTEAREMRLRVNKTDDVYRQFLTMNRWWSRFRYGTHLPSGVYGWDFWNAEDIPSSGDFRDAVDSEAVSTLESIISVDSGAVLGIGNNFLDTQREIIQVLQA
jgi:hypothetical protein